MIISLFSSAEYKISKAKYKTDVSPLLRSRLLLLLLMCAKRFVWHATQFRMLFIHRKGFSNFFRGFLRSAPIYTKIKPAATSGMEQSIKMSKNLSFWVRRPNGTLQARSRGWLIGICIFAFLENNFSFHARIVNSNDLVWDHLIV